MSQPDPAPPAPPLAARPFDLFALVAKVERVGASTVDFRTLLYEYEQQARALTAAEAERNQWRETAQHNAAEAMRLAEDRDAWRQQCEEAEARAQAALENEQRALGEIDALAQRGRDLEAALKKAHDCATYDHRTGQCRGCLEEANRMQQMAVVHTRYCNGFEHVPGSLCKCVVDRAMHIDGHRHELLARCDALQGELARQVALTERAEAERDALAGRVRALEAALGEVRKLMDWQVRLSIADRGMTSWATKLGNKKWWKRLDGTPIPNDLSVHIAEAFGAALSTALAPPPARP